MMLQGGRNFVWGRNCSCVVILFLYLPIYRIRFSDLFLFHRTQFFEWGIYSSPICLPWQKSDLTLFYHCFDRFLFYFRERPREWQNPERRSNSIMSLTDRRRGAKLMPPELPEGAGISRSKSFAGFLNRTISRRESMNAATTNPLGHDYRMRMMQRSVDRSGSGGTKLTNSKAPKTPRPLRALAVIETLRTGLR